MEPPEAAAERRVFFALWPPAGVASQLHAAAGAAQAACGGRAMRRETLHITLAFLGGIAAPRLADAEDAASRTMAPAFEMTLDRLGYWKHNRILWAGCMVAPAALVDLAGALAARLTSAGFRLDERPFAVHATLLRNAACATPPALAATIRWPVIDFALVESHGGSRYEVLRRWPLAMAVD